MRAGKSSRARMIDQIDATVMQSPYPSDPVTGVVLKHQSAMVSLTHSSRFSKYISKL